ncbi:MAG: zinc-dependent alcohol dehydrogenase family protein [Nitrospinae bacterium]|nr:zinc-dependent alcohol dehydrogenase family protein [Nitrospinota bacterium]
MKAWVLNRPGPVESHPLILDELPTPKPGRGEVLIKISACGVCHTDLHTVEGEIIPPAYPITPGHQVVGRVAEAGDGVSAIKSGDRVGVAWLFGACGVCPHCASGRENLCDKAVFTGFHKNGGYAEYMTAPETSAFHLPERFDDIHAAPLLCAGIIGYRALKVCGIRRGGRLGLFGFGASAHLTIQAAIGMGAEVYAFSRSDDHRQHALELGAVWAGSAQDTPSAPLDAAISFAPSGALVPLALEKLAKGGTLALAGIYLDAIPAMDYEKHIFHEKVLRSVTAFTREDAREFLQLADTANIKTDVEEYRFEEANEALLRLKESRIKGAAVLRISE